MRERRDRRQGALCHEHSTSDEADEEMNTILGNIRAEGKVLVGCCGLRVLTFQSEYDSVEQVMEEVHGILVVQPRHVKTQHTGECGADGDLGSRLGLVECLF